MSKDQVIVNNAQKRGLRVIGRRGHPEVRKCLIRFAAWLRKEYKFPVRLNVYLSPHRFVIAKIDGEKCVGSRCRYIACCNDSPKQI